MNTTYGVTSYLFSHGCDAPVHSISVDGFTKTQAVLHLNHLMDIRPSGINNLIVSNDEGSYLRYEYSFIDGWVAMWEHIES